MAIVKLKNVNKFYGSVQALFDVSLDIEDGAFVVFVGPSGCGKSTLLRSIAGLEGINSGEIAIGDNDVSNAAPADRGVSMVFQSYALYPHMTVRQNMEFGMKVNGVEAAERTARVNDASRILQLEEYLDRKPGQLSGGQRQRVAIGRSIVRNPKVFLFDEPLSNLDAKLRVQMRVELEALHNQLSATMIYVTHDQVEAMTMADKIVVLNGGRVEQVGSPMDLYHRPNSKFVAEFIGSPAMNVFEPTKLPGQRGLSVNPQTHYIGCRPEHILIGEGGTGTFDASVKVKEQLGGESLLYIEASRELTIVVRTDGDDQTKQGDVIGVEFPTHRLHQFDKGGEALR
ncbi:MAG: sn-glycerol-3-phosphate ABC transporter ATP-binding protein UgpC [Stappiaceae bacterium]